MTVLAEQQSAIDAQKAVIVIERPGALPIPVDQLRMVLRHVLINALTFRDPGGSAAHIVFSGTNTDTECTLSVADNGIGIEPAQLERVQRMFQRLHERERFPGLGVGLAIVKKIAVRNGGRLEIASSIGKGTTVTLIFPR